MHVEEDGHSYVEVMKVWSDQKKRKGKEVFIDCCDQSHTAVSTGKKPGVEVVDIFLSLISIFQFSRSTPPSCGLLCPWHIVRVALSLSRSQPLSSHHPSLCSVLAPSVSCHVRLSSWSRRGSRVSKRTVNFPGWRWRAINNPKHRHTV